MELKVLSTNIVEPITVADQKAFMGYTPSDQDAVIFRMIQTARVWLENRTGLSLVNKQYKAYFEKEDAINGWYELPVSPVQTTPAIAVKVCSTTTTFEQMGLDRIRIRPDTVIGTTKIGATGQAYYVETTFNAGASNDAANEILKRVVSSMFNAREDGGGAEVLTGRIPFDTMRLIEAIDQTTGF